MYMYMLSTCLHDRELGLEGGRWCNQEEEVCIQEEELEGALSLSLSVVSVLINTHSCKNA